MIRSDGLYIRDYVYVEDAVEACLRLSECMEVDPTILGQAFNFSYERPMKALEVVDRVLAIMGQPDLTPEIRDEVKNEIPQQYLSAAKARERLKWRPRFDFEEGLQRTVAWYRRAFENGIAL